MRITFHYNFSSSFIIFFKIVLNSSGTDIKSDMRTMEIIPSLDWRRDSPAVYTLAQPICSPNTYFT